jgi:glycerol-3-phosphate dehydrogenase
MTASFAGLRPLVARRPSASTAKLSREHLVDVSPLGLVTIAGGKWTTYRAMAQDTIDVAIARSALAASPCITAELRLHDDSTAELRALAAEHIDLADTLCEGFAYTKADVVNAFRNEMARTVDDVVARRTRLSFLDEAAARDVRPLVERLRAYA